MDPKQQSTKVDPPKPISAEEMKRIRKTIINHDPNPEDIRPKSWEDKVDEEAEYGFR